jgi:hypothetical protein
MLVFKEPFSQSRFKVHRLPENNNWHSQTPKRIGIDFSEDKTRATPSLSRATWDKYTAIIAVLCRCKKAPNDNVLHAARE